jgi:hypothetical protein
MVHATIKDVVVHPHGNICDVNARSFQREANARLIAAAPELLEALKHASGVLNEVAATQSDKLDPHYLTKKEVCDALFEMGKAIAKAEGGS